ncbi:MAG: hypothetical protein Q9225_001180 [Loekoesia sp. 1 TL-2023]
MRSLLVTLVFALSVSARCVGKNRNKQAAFPALKQGAQDDPGTFSNSTINGGQGPSNGAGGSLGTSTSSITTTTPTIVNSGQGGQSSNQVSMTTAGTGATTTDTSNGGAAQTSSPSGTSTSNTGSSNNPPTGSGGTSTGSTSTGASSGNCGSLKGVAFNGGMQLSMYDKITTATSWLTFQLDIPGGGASTRTTKDHVPMMAFASNVADAVNLVNGPNPPPWLLTFNEPDFSYMGSTPTMTPQEAADAIKPLLDKPGTSTKFVGPATADPNSNWHGQFYAACGCKDFFSAYNIHQYHKDSKDVVDQVTAFHNRFSDKPLWITEVAPGQAGCSVSWDAAGQFMKDVFKFAKESGFVDRVFWNSGNQLTNGDQNVCNSWLIDAQGNPGPLLATFESVDCT